MCVGVCWCVGLLCVLCVDVCLMCWCVSDVLVYVRCVDVLVCWCFGVCWCVVMLMCVWCHPLIGASGGEVRWSQSRCLELWSHPLRSSCGESPLCFSHFHFLSSSSLSVFALFIPCRTIIHTEPQATLSILNLKPRWHWGDVLTSRSLCWFIYYTLLLGVWAARMHSDCWQLCGSEWNL